MVQVRIVGLLRAVIRPTAEFGHEEWWTLAANPRYQINKAALDAPSSQRPADVA
jgi:hypothetical protein